METWCLGGIKTLEYISRVLLDFFEVGFHTDDEKKNTYPTNKGSFTESKAGNGGTTIHAYGGVVPALHTGSILLWASALLLMILLALNTK